jgi:hypothetical protein
MPETRDKRRRNDLDLFVLALIDSGISTPYTFQKEAGLSQGATIPALQRLFEAGFIRRGKPGPRDKTDCRITIAGKKHLTNGWHSLLEGEPSGDLDADLRVALLVLWVGGGRQLAVKFLRRSAERMQKSMQAGSAGLPSTGISSLASQYRFLRGSAAKALLEAQVIAVTSLAESIPTKLPRRHKTAGRRSST